MIFNRLSMWIIIGIIAMTIPFAALAETEEETTSEDSEVVVTATRTPTEQSEAPGTVDVVTHEEIEENNPGTQDLSEYLSLNLGVQLNTNGYDGSVSSVNLRGAGSEQVLVMLNGIPLVNPQNGSASLNYLPTDMIDRVEIAQGPLSALYGEDAMGGVINIIPGGETGGKFKLGGSSYASGDMHFSYLWEKAGFMLGTSRSDGYRTNSEYDGNWQYGFVRPTIGNWDLEMGYYRYADEKGLPGSETYETPTAIGRDRQQVFYITAKTDYTFGETILRAYRTAMDSYYRDDWSVGDNHAYRLGTEAQNTWKVNPYFTWVTVAKWEKTGVESNNFSDKDGLSRSVTGQLAWSPNEYVTAYIGNLWSDHSIYGTNNSPRLAVVYKPTNEWTFKANVGKAFRAPTYNELYWEDPYMQGDPNLKPERTTSYELDAEYQFHDRFVSRFSIYRSMTSNLIEWVPDDRYVWNATNHQKARLDGIDLSNTLKFAEHWRAGLQIHRLWANDYNPATGEYDQAIESRVPLSSVASLLFETGRIQAAWFTRYFYSHGNVDSSAISDLAFSFAFHDGFHLRAGVQNIFDREYCFNDGYPMPGINYRLEFGYNF